MKKMNVLIMLSMLVLAGCLGDDDEESSTNQNGAVSLTCDLAESAWLEEGTFEDQDLGSVDASCSNGVVTFTANNTSEETTTIVCADETEFTAKAKSGSIEFDMSEADIVVATQTFSGNASMSATFEAEIDETPVKCSVSVSVDLSDPESEPSGTNSLKCGLDGAELTQVTDDLDSCAGSDAKHLYTKWLSYFESLMPMD